MKNNIKSKKIIGIMLITILVLTSNVFAANDSFKTALSVNNSQVKQGENVTVTISLNDIAIESGEKGIGAYTSNIEFDNSVLEYVSSEGTDNWEAPFYQNSKIVGNTKNAEVVKTSQSIGTITFKVKDDAKLGETTIKLTNFSGSATVDIAGSDSSVTFTVIAKDTTNGSQAGTQSGNQAGTTTGSGNQIGTGSTNTQGTGTSNSGNKISVGNTTNNKENVKQGVLPQTGEENTGILMLMTVCALIGMILLIKIKLVNRKIEKDI